MLLIQVVHVLAFCGPKHLPQGALDALRVPAVRDQLDAHKGIALQRCLQKCAPLGADGAAGGLHLFQQRLGLLAQLGVLLLQGFQLLQLDFQALLFLHQTTVLAGVADALLLQVGLELLVSHLGRVDPRKPGRSLQFTSQDLPTLLQHVCRALDVLLRLGDGGVQRLDNAQCWSVFGGIEQAFRQVFRQQIVGKRFQAGCQFGGGVELAFQLAALPVGALIVFQQSGMIGALEAGQLALNILQGQRQRFTPLQLAIQLAHLRPCGQEGTLSFLESGLLRLRARRIVNHLEQRLLAVTGQRGDLPLAEQAHRKALLGDGLTGRRLETARSGVPFLHRVALAVLPPDQAIGHAIALHLHAEAGFRP